MRNDDVELRKDCRSWSGYYDDCEHFFQAANGECGIVLGGDLDRDKHPSFAGYISDLYIYDDG